MLLLCSSLLFSLLQRRNYFLVCEFFLLTHHCHKLSLYPRWFQQCYRSSSQASKKWSLARENTESKASADSFCILPCRAQMAVFSQPLPYFSWRPQILRCFFLHSSTYVHVIQISLSFPTLRMETSLHSGYTLFRTNYLSNLNLAAYFHIWSTNKL